MRNETSGDRIVHKNKGSSYFHIFENTRNILIGFEILSCCSIKRLMLRDAVIKYSLRGSKSLGFFRSDWITFVLSETKLRKKNEGIIAEMTKNISEVIIKG